MTPDDPRIYVRVLRHLQGQIDDGTLRDGQPTPTIAALCRRFGCTRQTAAKALRILEDDGHLTTWPGLGYYVSTLGGPGQAAGRQFRRLPDERIDHPREFGGAFGHDAVARLDPGAFGPPGSRPRNRRSDPARPIGRAR